MLVHKYVTERDAEEKDNFLPVTKVQFHNSENVTHIAKRCLVSDCRFKKKMQAETAP